ncbi:MAG: CDP-diacylglycerol--serine O-phosphatidyltransferase [Myxococcales bacterium]|nr:CDP-diacylglycerol--serine O-phosphatidyltransferase [Myxococcales bacterium]
MKVDLRKSLFILPNLFTLSSVLCGFYAILTATKPDVSNDDFYRASILVIFAMFFDTIDGRVARLTKTQSAIGVQLDSLADVVSFGVTPAVIVYRWALESFGTAGMLVCFGYLACGTIRLARFNVLATEESGAPKKPGKYILGLPIPAAAGILISLVVANTAARQTSMSDVLGHPSIVLAVVIALSFFMVSTIRFRSFKDIKLSVRTVVLLVLALGSTIFIAFRLHISLAFVWLLGSYIVIGLVETILQMTPSARRRRREEAEEGA